MEMLVKESIEAMVHPPQTARLRPGRQEQMPLDYRSCHKWGDRGCQRGLAWGSAEPLRTSDVCIFVVKRGLC